MLVHSSTTPITHTSTLQHIYFFQYSLNKCLFILIKRGHQSLDRPRIVVTPQLEPSMAQRRQDVVQSQYKNVQIIVIIDVKLFINQLKFFILLYDFWPFILLLIVQSCIHQNTDLAKAFNIRYMTQLRSMEFITFHFQSFFVLIN